MQTVEQRETKVILAMSNKIKELQDALKEVDRICHEGGLAKHDAIMEGLNIAKIESKDTAQAEPVNLDEVEITSGLRRSQQTTRSS